MLKNAKTINPLLLFLVLACIAMPQVNSNIGRMLRVPPAIVLQIGAGSERGEQYADMIFGFNIIKSVEDGWMLLVPRTILKFPDASRGFCGASGQRQWALVLQMN